ncbi:MAG: hypothetical protein JSV17_18050 [Candidatus Aminicenantes bacterium]|nr:MAG: hypothetical protein JSV17_18050 [Candidatus Aminicenantes bacterium]
MAHFKQNYRSPTGLILLLCLFFIHSSQTNFLTPTELIEDLDQFQQELEERFAYLKVHDVDYKSTIQAIREQAENGMSLEEFGLELRKVIGLFIDCHAGISGIGYPEGYLPFQIEPVGERYVAFSPDRTEFVDPLYPFITKIDTQSIDDWCKSLEVIVPKGSPQHIKYRTLRIIEFIQYARLVTGQAQSNSVIVELESEDGKMNISLPLIVADQAPPIEPWPYSQSRVLKENIGYLRIKGWNEDAFNEAAIWMPRFPAARGLIVDIRGNRGGTRNVLRDLYPYFVEDSDTPHVAGASKYRLYSEFKSDHLYSRKIFPLNWEGWTFAERLAITEFMQTFEPEWKVPDQEFSVWHFWVLSKRSKPDAYYFNKPIVFLMDDKCFSASDVILSSVRGMPNITLIGTPSRGGSGAYVATTLKNSGLNLRLSSMASFQNTGILFDSRGVEPDIFIASEPEFFLKNGADKALELAVQTILDRSEMGGKAGKIRRDTQ